MTREQVFEKIDNNSDFSEKYKMKLKNTYDFFAGHGYSMTVHALTRACTSKIGRRKREYTLDDVLEVLQSPINYIDGETRYVHFYNGFSAIEATDTGEIITFVDNFYKPSRKWRKKDV